MAKAVSIRQPLYFLSISTGSSYNAFLGLQPKHLGHPPSRPRGLSYRNGQGARHPFQSFVCHSMPMIKRPGFLKGTQKDFHYYRYAVVCRLPLASKAQISQTIAPSDQQLLFYNSRSRGA